MVMLLLAVGDDEALMECLAAVAVADGVVDGVGVDGVAVRRGRP